MGNRFDLIGDMKSFMRPHGGDFKEWYVGASLDPHATLFETHKVIKTSDNWIYLVAESAETAKEVVSHFTDVLGTRGDLEKLPKDAHFVYAYKMAKTTTP